MGAGLGGLDDLELADRVFFDGHLDPQPARLFFDLRNIKGLRGLVPGTG
jgi:hypothetical protein